MMIGHADQGKWGGGANTDCSLRVVACVGRILGTLGCCWAERSVGTVKEILRPLTYNLTPSVTLPPSPTCATRAAHVPRRHHYNYTHTYTHIHTYTQRRAISVLGALQARTLPCTVNLPAMNSGSSSSRRLSATANHSSVA